MFYLWALFGFEKQTIADISFMENHKISRAFFSSPQQSLQMQFSIFIFMCWVGWIGGEEKRY